MSKNVKKKEDFNQVVVWPSTIVGESEVTNFEKFLQDTFGVRGQYLEEIKTLPDIEDGVDVSDTGGRNDVLFTVHKHDINKFSVPRLQYGMRWIEDALDNNPEIYEKRIHEYRTW